jgi:hypothetical protein
MSPTSFEAYTYYASTTRTAERASKEKDAQRKKTTTFLHDLLTRLAIETVNPTVISRPENNLTTAEAQWSTEQEVRTQTQAFNSAELNDTTRSVRTATWGSVALLIVTDILGPTGAP